MVRQGTINRFVILAGLMLLFLSVVTLQGYCYVSHEDPGNTASIHKVNDEVLLQAHVQDMIYRAFMITYNINISRYDNSNTYLKEYNDVYQNYHTMVEYSSIHDSVYNDIDRRMGAMKNDLDILVSESKKFDDEYANFTRYKSNGEIVNATRSAIIARNYYKNLSNANTSYTSNAAVIVNLLNETIVYTYPLNFSYMIMNWTMLNYTNNEAEIDERLSHTVLALTTEQTEVNVGSRVVFDIRLKTDNAVPVAGQKVTLYVNDRKSGEGLLSSNGSCSIVFMPDDWNSSLTTYAELIPDDPGIVPVKSEPLEIHVTDRPTILSMSFTPATVFYGDILSLSGSLTALDGQGVAGRSVDVYLKNRRIGTVKTAGDGSYAFAYRISHEVPANTCTLVAKFAGQAGNKDVNLPSESAPAMLDVVAQATGLTLKSRDIDLIGGDIGEFSGALTLEDGTPVRDAMIYLYDGNRQLGRNATDGNGIYTVRLTIPYDTGTGSHPLYTVFQAVSQSLEGATSNNLTVTFGEVRPHIVGNTVPRVLFDGDGMSVQGYLLTQNDMPMAGQNVTINLPDGTTATVTTNMKGRYEYLYRISYKDRAGQSDIFVKYPGYTYAEGSTLVLPYNKLAMIMAVLIIPPTVLYIFIKLTRFDRFVLRRMKRRSSATTRKRYAGTPAVSVTVPELPVPAPALDLEQEMTSLKAMISDGRLKDALVSVYAVARRIAVHYGNEVNDSSTHREFYWQVAGKYSAVSHPLSTIINKYESVNYGRGTLNGNDVDVAMDSLRNVYLAMGSQGAEEPRS